MRTWAISVVSGALTLLAGSAAAQAPLPLWELGVVVGTGYVPDYPAADEYSGRVLPLPYFVYRGSVFRSEESGMLRGRIISRERIELDISVAGALDVKSKDNTARSGMPDLDWMGQIGPRLQITLARAAKDAHIDLEIPVRAVLSIDFSHFRHIGYMSVPELAYQNANFLGRGNRIKLAFGATFADREFQNVIYGVPAEFAMATRPEYTARGGYMGSMISFGWIAPVTPTLRVVGQVRGDHLGGAANESSPLFRSKMTGSLLVGAIWSFARSRGAVTE